MTAITNGILLAVAASGEKISIGEAAATAIFGYCVVFSGLAILMAVLYCTGTYFKKRDAKAANEAKSALENISKQVEANPLTVVSKPAPGSAGKIKLYDVPDKEAAMLMAIVADKMQKPINELHFISIKEVKD